MNLLNEQNESEPSSAVSGAFKFGKDDEKLESPSGSLSFRRSNTSNSTSPPLPTNSSSRWGRGFFKAPSITQLNVVPKTPPPESTPSPPPKFSPGAWGASLSAASRKLNKLRLTPTSSPDISPSQSKTAVSLEERLTALTSINRATTAVGTKVSAAVRDSFERRNEIISKVGGWVANTNDPEAQRDDSSEWEEVDKPRGDRDSRANEEIKKLESEMFRKERVEITPEEYIARIKRRQLEREEAEKNVINNHNVKGIEDPLGVGGVS